MNNPLQVFYDYNDFGIVHEKVSSLGCEYYRDILPTSLINIWKTQGLLHFKNRFLWMVNPDDYIELLPFFGINTKSKHVFMRTALGGLFFIQPKNKTIKIEGEYYFYCPIFKQTTYLADSFTDVMNGWLTTPEVYEPLTHWPIHDLAKKKLPTIESNECYGFVPAIALGGDFDPDNLQVFPLKEHLSFLMQL